MTFPHEQRAALTAADPGSPAIMALLAERDALREQVVQLTAALERIYDAFKKAAETSVATRQAFETVAADATLAAWVYGP